MAKFSLVQLKKPKNQKTLDQCIRVENREYIVEGFGVPASQKMFAQISLQWYPEQLEIIDDLNSMFKIVPKVQV